MWERAAMSKAQLDRDQKKLQTKEETMSQMTLKNKIDNIEGNAAEKMKQPTSHGSSIDYSFNPGGEEGAPPAIRTAGGAALLPSKYPLGVVPYGSERPLKAYGERKYRGPFRVFKGTLNCEAYTYAWGCGGRSRGQFHCIWCVNDDFCVQGTFKGGPDGTGKRALQRKNLRCDRWIATAD